MANEDNNQTNQGGNQGTGNQTGGKLPDPNTQTLNRSNPPGDLKKSGK